MQKKYYIKELTFLSIGLCFGQALLILSIWLIRIDAKEAAFAIALGVGMALWALYTGSRLLWLEHHPDAENFDTDAYERKRLAESYDAKTSLIIQESERIKTENDDLRNECANLHRISIERHAALSSIASQDENISAELSNLEAKLKAAEKRAKKAEQDNKGSLLLTIAALLDLIASKPRKLNQSGVINEILSDYPKVRGLSKRNLEENFSAANSAAEQAIKESV